MKKINVGVHETGQMVLAGWSKHNKGVLGVYNGTTWLSSIALASHLRDAPGIGTAVGVPTSFYYLYSNGSQGVDNGYCVPPHYGYLL